MWLGVHLDRRLDNSQLAFATRRRALVERSRYNVGSR